MAEIGVVIIGRNEGVRLAMCLRSLAGRGVPLVYVDSGSTDASVETARAQEAEVVHLTPPYSAAKARNAGLARLLEMDGGLRLVQFVDGDVEVADQWLWAAQRAFAGRPDVAVICGRLRERHPEASIYNRLCDMEWDRPAGETGACGGIAMMRVEALRQTGGFREDLIAGEEPELCLRMRREGWKILRLADDMGWHDAAMMRFGQWWRRSVRAGHSYAQGAWLHGRSSERFYVRELISIALWAGVLPLVAIAGVPLTGGWSVLLLGVLPVQWARIAMKEHRRGRTPREAVLGAGFMMIGKFAQLQGMLRFAMNVLRGRSSVIIEYKAPQVAAGPVKLAGGE